MAEIKLNELELQDKFYNEVLNITPNISLNTDGIYKGILFENKVSISNLDSTLMQSIKYLSKIRNRGLKLPAYIVNTDFTKKTVYIYKSINYLNLIEQVYLGASSKDNNNYDIDYETDRITYKYDHREDKIKLLEFIANVEKAYKNNTNEFYITYNVDFNNILGLAKEYYKLNTNSTAKDDLLNTETGELRKPNLLKDRINPYTEDNNNAFSSIMDCLNPRLLQKELGAFFTPDIYAKKSQEMLISYINEIKSKNKDYIVIDRCAGTGNLFRGLSDEILEHCILSTVEPNEYLILQEEFGNKGVVVVPPMDALAYDIIPTEIDNEGNIISDLIRDKIKDPNCVIIMYENPPYSEVAGGTTHDKAKANAWKNSYICTEMKKEYKGVITNDLANLFIWSAFKYYLRNEDDSYIVYSPIKYWKSHNIVKKKIKDGYIVNRKHFHATNSAIALIQWLNKDDITTNSINCKIINDDHKLIDIEVNKVSKLLSNAYDKRTFTDDTEDGIICEANGLEFDNNGRQIRIKPVDNKNIIGYMVSAGFDIDIKNVYLVRNSLAKGNGFYLRADNYLEKLPLFVASLPSNVLNIWYNRGLVYKSYDKGDVYLSDNDFIRKCFIYTCLSFQNKCRSLFGSNNKLYYNELTFNNQDIDNDTESYITLADKQLKIYKDNNELTNTEKDLINRFYKILTYIRNKDDEDKYLIDEYIDSYTYGTFQIKEEINIKIQIKEMLKNGNEVDKYVHKYSTLNTHLDTLKEKLSKYYLNHIYDDLLKYELIK